MPDLSVVAPGAVGRRRKHRRSRLPIVVATGLTCAMAGVLAVQNRTHTVAVARTAGSAVTPPVPAPVPDKAVAQPATVTFWAGKLPGSGGRGEIACRRTTLPDGTVGQNGVLIWRKATIVTRDCADGMTGTWWRSPGKRWFYLAAAAPHVKMRLTGKKAVKHGRLLVVKGHKAKNPPARAIVLTAR
jgi:hypothetical protein